jgi:hypothetical protein
MIVVEALRLAACCSAKRQRKSTPSNDNEANNNQMHRAKYSVNTSNQQHNLQNNGQ